MGYNLPYGAKVIDGTKPEKKKDIIYTSVFKKKSKILLTAARE